MLISNFVVLLRTDFAKQMITMSKAATNTCDSSEDDDNDVCSSQGTCIYDKDERFILTDDILLYIRHHAWSLQNILNVAPEISKAAAIKLITL